MTAMCLAYYRARRDWDAAFELIARRGPTEELEPLLREALDELLDTARLPTIEAWCEFVSAAVVTGPGFSIARAEVALRHGRHTEAQAFAEIAASAAPDLSFRGLSLAGRAAHLGSREEDGLQLYRRAERVATTENERRDALWGQLLCALELELPETPETLENLRSTPLTDAREVVRAAAYELGYQVKFGSLDLADAEVASQLVGAVSDPLVSTSFQNVYGHVLGLSARYDEALEVAKSLLTSVRKYRLDFALPYGLTLAAVSEAGLRRWESAAVHLDEASAVSRMSRNAHAEQVCYAVRVRVLAQQGKQRAALSLELPTLRPSLPAIRAEVLSSRALALAAVDRVDEACSLIDEIRASTRAIEPTVLSSAVDALASLKRREHTALELVAALEATAFRTGALDLLVTAYRTSPELLATLLRSSQDSDRLGMVIRRVGDEDLAKAVGHPVVLSGDDRRQQLSPREREVYDLLCQGLSNRQIAEALFISESTVKLHAHHVYDKLGTRSRTALAVQAALERGGQATSATDDSGMGGA